MEKVIRNAVKKYEFIYLFIYFCINPAPSSLFLLPLSHMAPCLLHLICITSKHRMKLRFHPSGGTPCHLCNYDVIHYSVEATNTQSMTNSHPHFTHTEWSGGWQNVPRREWGSTPLVHCISVMVGLLITTLKTDVGDIFLPLADASHLTNRLLIARHSFVVKRKNPK